RRAESGVTRFRCTDPPLHVPPIDSVVGRSCHRGRRMEFDGLGALLGGSPTDSVQIEIIHTDDGGDARTSSAPENSVLLTCEPGFRELNGDFQSAMEPIPAPLPE